ncbi:MAG: hypothetical protein ACMZ7B_00295 [Balneola sp.]
MKKGVLSAALAFCWVMLSSQVTIAQFTVQHQQPTVLNRNSINTLEFFVSGINENDILQALLFFKNEGDLGYSQKEIGYQNGVFTAVLAPEELQEQDLNIISNLA